MAGRRDAKPPVSQKKRASTPPVAVPVAEAARRLGQGRAAAGRGPHGQRRGAGAALRGLDANAHAWRIGAGSAVLSAAASSRDPQALSQTVTLAAH
ncbi:hypothetical protein P350_05955 [Burkholderia cepacia JBK9]|nr:hypothetical protein P350_05955 [Burkholderia cepacia JBK9]